MALAVRSVVFDIIGRDNASKAFLSASRNAELAANRFDRSTYRIQAASARLGKVGKAMSKAITIPVAIAAAYSIDQAAKFQKSMTLIEVATGELHSNMALVSAGIQSIAKGTGTSLDQLSAGMYMVEKGGYRGAAGLKVLKAAAQGAKAENVDLSTATFALTSIMKSYRLNSDQAVQAENALIRGSGLAKTTMADFAGSLSNVVPLAAALGIKLPEIFAAIATMTQHGETAQRSTENLSNLLTNLAGSNNTAANAMQQLGVNVIDLQKNLGKRGLENSLNLVINKMREQGKGGLVVYDSLKRAAQGTQSLRDMLASMTGILKINSQALLHNKMGIKEYQAFAKGMGGTAGATALQFLAAVKSVKGFNNLLRSGRGDTQTYAKALQTAFGGMTGLKAVLMLLGGEFKRTGSKGDQFKQITDQITKASRQAGTDVLGWSKTSGTLSNKTDRMVQALKVLAVQLGTVLIPAVSKLVGWISSATTWFNHLSSGKRKLIGWAVAVLALLGPVLAILSRLTIVLMTVLRTGSNVARFEMGMRGMSRSMDTMGTTAYKNGGRVRRMFGLAGASAATAATATADAEAVQSKAVISSTDRQIAALTRLRAAQRGTAASAVVASEETAAASNVAGRAGGFRSRFGIGGGIGLAAGIGLPILGDKIAAGSSRGSARNRVGTGLSDAGSGALIGSMILPGYGTAIGAVAGGLYGAAQIGGGPLSKAKIKAVYALAAAQKAGAAAARDWTNAQLATGDAHSIRAQTIAATALGKTGLGAKGSGLTGFDLNTGLTGTNAEYRRVLETIKATGGWTSKQIAQFEHLRAVFDRSGKAAIAHAVDEGITLAAMVKTGTETDLLTGKLINLNAAHLSARTAAAQFASQVGALDAAVAANGKTLNLSSVYGRENAAALKQAATAAVRHAQAVYDQTGNLKLADGALRHDVTALESNASAAGLNRGQVKLLVDQLINLSQHKDLRGKISIDTVTAQANIDALNSALGRYLAAISGMPGVPQLPSATTGTPVGSLNSLLGPGNYPTSPVPDPTAPTTSPFGSPPTGPQGGYGSAKLVSATPKLTTKPPSTVSGGALGDKANNALNAANAAKAAKQQVADARSAAQAAIGPLLVAVRSFKSTASELRQAAVALRQAAKAGKVGGPLQTKLANQQDELVKLGAERDKIRAELAKRDALINTSRSAMTGSVDITTMGQDSWGVSRTGLILTKIKKMAADARKFARLVRLLARRGLPRALVMQLVNAGPAALGAAQALEHATPGQFNEIKAAYVSIARTGTSLGKALGNDWYGAGKHGADKFYDGLKSREARLNKLIRNLGYSMARELERALGMKLTPNPPGGKAAHSSGGVTQNITINGITDPEAFAKIVARRLAVLVA